MSDAFVDGLLLENMLKHIRTLRDIAPSRVSGSDGERRAAEYIVDTLASYGIDAAVTSFPGYMSLEIDSHLEIAEQGGQAIPSRAVGFSESGQGQDVRTEVVYLRGGSHVDYEGVDVRGKVVLVDVSFAPGTPEKARIASSHGAAGLILANWGPPGESHVPWRAVKSVWGNPTTTSIGQIPSFFAVTVSKAGGEILKQRLAAGPVTVRMSARTTREWLVLAQPAGRVTGGHSKRENVLVAGHLDAWEPGVTDNLTGNAIILEIARVLHARRSELRRDILLAFWSGHEVGEGEGSTYFVDTHWDELDTGCVAYVYVDTLGMIQTDTWMTASILEVKRFHSEIETRLLKTTPQWRRMPRIGDQSLLGLGVPSMYGRTYHAKELINQWGGATLGWWNHTSADDLDKLDAEKLAIGARVNAAYVSRLAHIPTIPYQFEPGLLEIVQEVQRWPASVLKELCLDMLPERIRRVLPRAKQLDEQIWNRYTDEVAGRSASPLLVDDLNRMTLRLCRMLIPLRHSVEGRYVQEPYGLSEAERPIPSLAWVDRWSKAERHGEEWYLLWTTLLQNGHRVSDGLRHAEELIDQALDVSA